MPKKSRRITEQAGRDIATGSANYALPDGDDDELVIAPFEVDGRPSIYMFSGKQFNKNPEAFRGQMRNAMRIEE